ncbi:MAG: polysaccharide biosynthesis protein, partial [Bacilli bacterium]|nr:polysaccharide biosynthesis protein [Bacilli bacterium]
MKKNSFIEGTIIATLAIVFVKILGMLYVIPFYSIVGSSGGALYSYAYNIYLIFLGISSAGLPNAISKIISEYNTLGYEDAKNRAYSIALKIITVISVLAFLILFILAEEIGIFIIGDLSGGNTPEDVAFVIRCVSPAVLIIPFLSITKGYLQGHKFVSPSSISQLIEQIVRIIVILVGSYLVLNVFNGSLSLAIGIAVAGAFIGGGAAYLYLKYIMRKHKDEFFLSKKTKKDKISNKEIALKIVSYAIPFIIINIVTNIYTFTDQILVLRTLEHMHYTAEEVEFIASAISTWAPKINMVINAMAMGMTVSLIPTIVSAYTKKDQKEVNDKINKSISMVTYISLPLVLGLSILSTPVWQVFYGSSQYGSMILSLAVFSALLANVYMIISTICQSLNKIKLVYLVSITGFLLNALLDVPIMYLFEYLHIEAFLGSIVASIIGFSSSILIGLIFLHKKENITYKETFHILSKTLIPAITMVVILIIFNYL